MSEARPEFGHENDPDERILPEEPQLEWYVDLFEAQNPDTDVGQAEIVAAAEIFMHLIEALNVAKDQGVAEFYEVTTRINGLDIYFTNI